MARKHILNQDGTPNWDTIAGFKERIDGHDTAVASNTSSLADIALNVKNLGADPTGVNDSTTVINNALATGNPIYFPKGTYLCSGQLNWNGKNDIRGAGLVHTIIKCTGSTGSIINSDSVQEDKFGTISDLTLDGNNTMPNLITINAGKGINIKRVRGRNFTSKGIILGDGTHQVWETTLDTLTLRGTDAPNTFPNYGIYVANTATDNIITKCMVANTKISQFYDIGGNNMFSLCHGYCYPTSYASQYTFECRGIGGNYSQCYSDTPASAGFYINNYNISLSNIKVYFPVGYTIPVNCYPVYIDNPSGTGVVTGLSINNLLSHADGVSSVSSYDVYVNGNAGTTWRITNTTGNFLYKWERGQTRGLLTVSAGTSTITLGTAFNMSDTDYLVFAMPYWDYGYIKITARSSFSVTFVTTNPAPTGGSFMAWQILNRE